VIGAFAYAGLRTRSATGTPRFRILGLSAGLGRLRGLEPIGAASMPRALRAHPATPTAALAEIPATAAPVAQRSAVEAATQKALAAHLPALKQACWKGRPPEARVRLMMNLSFDRTGAQIARGLSEPRLPEDQRAWILGLGPCISEKLPPLSIDPPGASVQVEIPIDFP
jgi:hypothetical protein